jgi:hypothetical protein
VTPAPVTAAGGIRAYGYACAECRTEENAQGAPLIAAVQARAAECRAAAHQVTETVTPYGEHDAR